MNQCCLACKFYLSGEKKSGVCRRFPPIVITLNSQDYDRDSGYGGIYSNTQSEFPEMSDDGWCGEYKQIKGLVT